MRSLIAPPHNMKASPSLLCRGRNVSCVPRINAGAIALVLGVASLHPALAVDRFWNPPDGGSGGSVSWNNGTNWGGVAPTDDLTSDIAIFNQTTDYNFQPALDAFTVQSIRGLEVGGVSAVDLTISTNTGSQTTDGAVGVDSSTITFEDVTGLAAGQLVTGSRIQLGTFVTAVDVGTKTITISRPTAGGTLNDATSLTFASSLEIGADGIVVAAGTVDNNAQIITAPIALGANQEWTNNSTDSSGDTLVLQGSIYLGSHTLTLRGVAGSRITFNGSSTTQSIGGSGSIIVDTEGRVNFGSGSGNRPQYSFTGGVTLNSGTMILSGGNSGGGDKGGNLGVGLLTINGGTIGGGGNIAGHALTISGQVWNADWTFGSNKSVDMGTGGITLGTAVGTTRTLHVNAGTGLTLTIGGVIANGTTANSLVKTGNSRLLLTADNTYTGSTTVSAGILQIDGSVAGAVNADGTGTLAGSGSIGGAVAVATGATFSPGNVTTGVPTLEAGITMETNSTFRFDLIADTDTLSDRGTLYDGVDVTGSTLNIQTGVIADLVFNASGSAVDYTTTFWDSNRSWLVFDNANAPTFVDGGIFGSITTSVDSLGANFSTTGGSFGFSQEGSDVYLNYVIPEPSTFLLAGVSLLTLVVRRRRRPTGPSASDFPVPLPVVLGPQACPWLEPEHKMRVGSEAQIECDLLDRHRAGFQIRFRRVAPPLLPGFGEC